MKVVVWEAGRVDSGCVHASPLVSFKDRKSLVDTIFPKFADPVSIVSLF